MIAYIAGAMLLSFVLGMFTVSMIKINNEYSAFRAGYIEATDEDISPHLLESEIIHAYKMSFESDRRP